MLFESLAGVTSFTGIFKNNRLAITPYFIPYSKTLEDDKVDKYSGLMYPTTLFANNLAMTTLSEAFANTVVAYNCVLSGSNEYFGLLANNTNLRNVSKTFANIHYFGRDITNAQGIHIGEWEQIFVNNTSLSNLSGCFAQSLGTGQKMPKTIRGDIAPAPKEISGTTKDEYYGFENLRIDGNPCKPKFPKYINYIFGDNGALHSDPIISDITYMFYNQISLTSGNLPEFNIRLTKLPLSKYKSCFGNFDFSSNSSTLQFDGKYRDKFNSNWTMSTT
jgi:hypothetical protein